MGRPGANDHHSVGKAFALPTLFIHKIMVQDFIKDNFFLSEVSFCEVTIITRSKYLLIV